MFMCVLPADGLKLQVKFPPEKLLFCTLDVSGVVRGSNIFEALVMLDHPMSGRSLYSLLRRACMKILRGTSTFPMDCIRFFPAFCFSKSLRFRDASPP